MAPGGPEGATVRTPTGRLLLSRPRAYTLAAGKRREVQVSYREGSASTLSFDTEGVTPDALLVIDPIVTYETTFGGSLNEDPRGLAVSPTGSAYVVGLTPSADFPLTPGAIDSTPSRGIFVSRFQPDGGSLVFSTFIGAAINTASPQDIALDALGNAYITGAAGPGFPTTSGAFDESHSGGDDAFVAKLNASGTALLYSTLLGGSDADMATAIAVDSAGSAYTTGYTESPDFPKTAGAFHEHSGGFDIFVTKLDAAGAALSYSTLLGVDGGTAEDIVVDPMGLAYISGNTRDLEYPTTTGAFSESLTTLTPDNPLTDAFITKLNPSGSDLVFSTLLGGTRFEADVSIALDDFLNVYVTGTTGSGTTFPSVPGSFTSGAFYDVFIAKLDPSGANLLYSIVVGGGEMDRPAGIGVNTAEQAVVAGSTTNKPTDNQSEWFYRTPGFHGNSPAAPTGADAFLIQAGATGNRLIYSSVFGGIGGDIARGVALDAEGNAYVLTRATASGTPSDVTLTKFAISAELPDFVAHTLIVDLTQNAGLLPGTEVNISAQVYNQGASKQTQLQVGVFLSADSAITSADHFLSACQVVAPLPGESTECAVTVTIPNSVPPGSYTFGAIADYQEQIVENSDLNNWTRGVPIHLLEPESADLVIDALTTETEAAADRPLEYEVLIRNAGATTDQQFRVGVYLSTDDALSSGDLVIASCLLPGLDADETSVCAGDAPLPANQPPGGYYAIAKADDLELVDEATESNNTRLADSGIVTIQAAANPVLKVTPPNLVFSVGLAGASVPQPVFVRNASTGLLPYVTSTTAPWLTAIPAAGTSMGEVDVITASVNSAGLLPGEYSAQLLVERTDKPLGVAVDVKLLVSDEPPSFISSVPAITLQSEARRPSPSPVTVIIDSRSGEESEFHITTSADWISVDPSAGTVDSPFQVKVSIDTAELGVGQHAAVVTVAEGLTAKAGPLTIPITINVVEPPPGPWISETPVLNAATYTLPGEPGYALSPGSIVSVFGADFAVGQHAAESIPLPLSLGGVSLTFNGIPAHLFFVNDHQINAQLPSGIGGTTAIVEVTNGQGKSELRAVAAQLYSPGIYSMAANGQGQGIVVFLNTSDLAAPDGFMGNSRPAKAGDILVAYANGLGAVSPPIADGLAPCLPDGVCLADGSNVVLHWANTVPEVTVGGVRVPNEDIFYFGLAPQFVGLFQINFKLPPAVPPGDTVPIMIQIAGVQSPDALTIAVE